MLWIQCHHWLSATATIKLPAAKLAVFIPSRYFSVHGNVELSRVRAGRNGTRYCSRNMDMFAFPKTAASDLLRTSMESQASTMSKMTSSIFDTSLQYFNLNTQALYKLMEESTSAAAKSMQLRTLPDLQAFIAEQSQLSFQRISGYSLNAQKIATDSLSGFSVPVASTATQSTRSAHSESEATEKSAASHHGAHEVDVQPSTLVEKMISSVVPDQGNLH
jgi:hypothetical protein